MERWQANLRLIHEKGQPKTYILNINNGSSMATNILCLFYEELT